MGKRPGTYMGREKEEMTDYYIIGEQPNEFVKLLYKGISIRPGILKKMGKSLFSNGSLLITATAFDQINKTNRFNLIYLFIRYSLLHRSYITVNTSLSIPSLSDIFPSAIWLEREIYDLFGIFFTHNTTSDLRRILTDYHFNGHPLRKDFSLIGYLEKAYSLRDKVLVFRFNITF